MTVAIHQPHYFPWLGWLDKMAKADVFILLDNVQYSRPSPIMRNRFLTEVGKDKYLSVEVQGKDHTNKSISEIELKLDRAKNFLVNHKNFLRFNYRKAPFFDEVYLHIEQILSGSYVYLQELLAVVNDFLINAFGIKTKILLQSQIERHISEWDKSLQKNELLVALLKGVGAKTYLSGSGAKKYMDDMIFTNVGISVAYQIYEPIEYCQFNTKEFIPNLSCLDMLFNCGFKESKQIFWRNVAR